MKRLAIAALLLALPWAARAKVYEFQNWAIACDNTRHCTANGSQGGDIDHPASLQLDRDGGPGARLTGHLQALLADDGKIGPLTLSIGTLNWKRLAENQDFDAAQTAELLAAMRDADAIALSDGPHEWSIALSGLKAALLKMDDLQGRVGTSGALIKKGGKPESSVPPAKPAPLLRPIEPPPYRDSDQALLQPILQALSKTDPECWNEMPDAENPEANLSRLNAHQLLAMRECSRGAYQSSYAAWIVEDKPPYRAEQAALSDEDGQDAPLMNPAFEHGVLSGYGKLRGIGDCGDSYSWAWTGREFKLMSAEKAPQCSGIPGGVPLRVWTTRRK
ncbi:DUF1176 domain-containing protein [Chromobacterium alticapitis]|nr:DUF1176 domain-containing protein [Chromobacterium alticapitis]